MPVDAGRHAPLACDGEVLALDDAGVGAGAVHQLVLVAVVVAEGEANVVVVVEASLWVAGDVGVISGISGIPFRAHKLHMELLVIADVERGFGIADSLECRWVVLLDEAGILAGGGVAVAAVMARDGLVEDLNHTDAGVGWVGVDAVGHPGQPLLSTSEVVRVVEAGGLVVLAGEDVFLLAAGGAVEVNNDIHAQVSSLLDNLVKVRKHAVAVSEGLAVLVDDVGVRPVADGDTDGVETNVVGGLDAVGVDPVSPVVLELLVAELAVASLVVVVHAVEFRRRIAAAHVVAPFVVHHPLLRDEPTCTVLETTAVYR